MGQDVTVLIASDAQASAARTRAALLRQGLSCPHSHIVSLDLAAQVAAERELTLIFVLIASDPKRATLTLGRLRAATASKIVAVGAASSPKDVLDAIHAGADDFLDESGEFDAELQGLLERIRALHSATASTGRVIAIASASGGSGASTLALNLAAGMAQRLGRCGLLDFRRPAGDLHLLLNLKPRYSLGDLCDSAAKLDQAMFQQAIVEHVCGISLLASDSSMAVGLPPSNDAIAEIVRLARADFPVVIIDLGGTIDETTFPVAQSCDTLMTVFRLDVVSIIKTRRSVEFLTEHGIEDGRLSLVGNRVGQAGELTKKTAERAVGRKIAHSLPDDPKIVNGAINVGSPALLEAPAAKVSKAIQLICDDLAASARGGGAGETSAIPETPIVLPRVVKRVADRLMTAVTDFEQQEESHA